METGIVGTAQGTGSTTPSKAAFVNILAEMESSGVSVEDIAQRLSVGPLHLRAAINGMLPLRVNDFTAICETFFPDIEAGYLLERADGKPRELHADTVIRPCAITEPEDALDVINGCAALLGALGYVDSGELTYQREAYTVLANSIGEASRYLSRYVDACA